MDKDAMIAAYERGECSYTGMVDHYIDTMRDAADFLRIQEREDRVADADDASRLTE